MKISTYRYGFSLIELMIVVSIISILAMMAMPSYQRYTHRARFAEIIAATQIYQTTVALALQEGIPKGEIKSGSYGIPTKANATKNLAEITVENGIITAKATEILHHATYILTPDEMGSTWQISGSCIEEGLCHA